MTPEKPGTISNPKEALPGVCGFVTKRREHAHAGLGL